MVARIKEAIAHYDITPDELFGGAKAKRGRTAVNAAGSVKKVRKAAKAAGVAKYGDGTGRTWSGVGKRPNWFKDALSAGKTAEELLIAK